MPYWIYGRDAKSDEPARRLFSEADSEEAARAEGVARGMLVEAVRAATAGDRNVPERTVPPTAGAYEFTPAQNETIASLSRYMRLAGVVLVLFGVLQAVAAFLATRNGVSLVIQGVVSTVLGALMISIAGHFRRIVDSRGRDIGHLMDALGQLRVMYAIQVWIVVAAIALIAIVIVVAFLR